MMNLLTTVKNRQERFTAVSRLSAADAKTTAAVGFPGEDSGGGLTSLGLCWEMVGYYGIIMDMSNMANGPFSRNGDFDGKIMYK